MGFEATAQWRPSSLLLVFVFFTIGLLLFFNVFQMQRDYISLPTSILITEQETHTGYLLETEGCRIPEMDPMDPTVRSFIFDEKPVICNDGIPALVDSDVDSLRVVRSSLAHYNLNDTSSLNCCYEPFWRVDPEGNSKDGKVKYAKKCVYFNDSATVTEEFVRVMCFYNKSTVYKDFFSFAPLKPQVKATKGDKDEMNVLVIGIDSVSRLNFYRQMPKTLKVLREIKAVELLGYNKVGDNTFPNLMPALTGLNENELKKACWPNTAYHFDNCPFVWKTFASRGYTTAFAEDASWMGLFNYQKRGFKTQPTHYFWDTFDGEAEKQCGNSHRLNVHECVGGRESYRNLAGYAEKFVQSMRRYDRTYFGFFWTSSLSHDFLNKPKLGDENFAALIRRLQVNKLLKNTAFIFLSDHGIRWGGIRSTFQGRIEERLPFIYIYLPEWFRDQYAAAYSNLLTNSKRLTTPFDLHATLVDLSNPRALTKKFLYARHENRTSEERSYSLFDPIPANRTCKDAVISSHWCTCQESVPIEPTNEIVSIAANFIVEYINRLLVGYADCARLSLDKVIDSRLQAHQEDIVKEYPERDYTLTLKTIPGGALFETTVRSKPLANGRTAFDVVGTISRINLYGKQSVCVTDFHLKLYCFCKQLL